MFHSSLMRISPKRTTAIMKYLRKAWSRKEVDLCLRLWRCKVARRQVVMAFLLAVSQGSTVWHMAKHGARLVFQCPYLHDSSGLSHGNATLNIPIRLYLYPLNSINTGFGGLSSCGSRGTQTLFKPQCLWQPNFSLHMGSFHVGFNSHFPCA